MAQGILLVEVMAAQQAIPISSATIRIFNQALTIDEVVYSDDEGRSDEVVLPCPERELSLEEYNDIRPYAVYHVDVTLDGYIPQSFRNVQIFADETSILTVSMFPQTERVGIDTYVLTPHGLYDPPEIENSLAPDIELQQRLAGGYPFIPEYITVHLGRPDANANNVTVSFINYIKNVASSEIYPTWPNASLRSNIYCQISLALNRVYTEWYRSRGYPFDITNSTAFDQYYVHNRDIFQSVSVIVDEIFNEYIRKIGTINPYYAEYCDGRIANCRGLKQWGTVTLAQQGRNALEILKYYYGNDIEIVATDRIQSITTSYPGTALRQGSRSDAVATIQRQLNRIAINYPSIPVNYPVDGIYGNRTRAAVLAFQRIFNLTQDGVVGKSTWYRISYIYVAVTKLAELTSEGERLPTNGNYPGFALRRGDQGVEVQEAQYYLDLVSDFTSYVPNLKIDGNFGTATYNAVVGFQRLANLTPDGIIGRQTWNTLRLAYEAIRNLNLGNPGYVVYPGTALRLGSRGENVRLMQSYLNALRENAADGPELTVDGIFGSATQSRVRAFQRDNGLEVDGIIGQDTWNEIVRQYGVILNRQEIMDEQSLLALENAETETNTKIYTEW
ncbi:MAG: peptidoglycan-binding protein [Erysipelotrichaceae bacterium]|nr:peptidoglycan-binding protein [Erysipelotrichaceae bacterium]